MVTSSGMVPMGEANMANASSSLQAWGWPPQCINTVQKHYYVLRLIALISGSMGAMSYIVKYGRYSIWLTAPFAYKSLL